MYRLVFRKFRLICLHVLFGCLCFSAVAQQTKFQFLTTAEGLAGNNTSFVVQDKNGFLWFINEGKLHRHDGRNFVVFAPSRKDSIVDESYLGVALYQDSLLFVWSEKSAYLFRFYV